MKELAPFKHPPAWAIPAIVFASALTVALLLQAVGSTSRAASGPQQESSREAALNNLHAQLKARAPFSAEETQILLRFKNGEDVSDLEADVVISRALYRRYVAGESLGAEQKALLGQYKEFIARNGKRIADLVEGGAGMKDSSGVIASAGTPNVCNSTPYTIAQSTGGAIVPGTTDTGNHCDDCTTPITLPFPYTLYDQTFTQARVSSNGSLQFVGSNQSFNVTCLPNAGFGYTIFAFWSDLFTLDGAAGQGVFTSVSGVAPNRVFNVEWRAKYCCDTGPPILRFEIRLFENSRRFDIVYGQTATVGERIAIGVQQAATAPNACFTQYSCGQSNPVFPGLVLTFGADFDRCIQDDATGALLRFNSESGAYEFRDCRKGIMLTGVGVVIRSVNNDFCKVTLSDGGPDPKRPDRNVQALVNTCTGRGDASVSIFSSGQSFSVGDSNVADSTCACP
jgi:hypothetical protein